MSETSQKSGFHALNLPLAIVNKLDRLGFTTPTPIQAQAIPAGIAGTDLIGIAQTGTGKTLGFALPIDARLQAGQVALVLAPTRELAEQIETVFRQLNFKTALLIGGASMGLQRNRLRANPSVVVATPGRLEDHLQQGSISLRNVGIVVLDEADRMLDMGFAPAIERILKVTPSTRQTMLFSATMPREIADLAGRYLRNPLRIEIERAGTAAVDVAQELMVVALKEEKAAMLGNLLKEHPGTVLVFARTRHGARKLAKTVRTFGHSAAELHSDRTLAQRRAALHGFKTGAFRVLVATDIAARGIDVKDITLVVNYDVPECAEDYVHRIGRTGRAGAAGRAITIATPEQHGDIRDIERLMKTELPLSAKSPLGIQRSRQEPRPQQASNRSRFHGRSRGATHRFRAR